MQIVSSTFVLNNISLNINDLNKYKQYKPLNHRAISVVKRYHANIVPDKGDGNFLGEPLPSAIFQCLKLL